MCTRPDSNQLANWGARCVCDGGIDRITWRLGVFSLSVGANAAVRRTLSFPIFLRSKPRTDSQPGRARLGLRDFGQRVRVACSIEPCP